MRIATSLVSLAALAACSGGYQVISEGAELPGMPFYDTQTFVRSGTYTMHTKLSECVKTGFEEIVALPTGQVRYLALDGATFSKSSVTMKYNDVGALTEFSFNTEPAGGESIEKAVGAVSSLLPIIGLAAEGGDAEAEGETKRGPACNTGAENVELRRWSPG